jgi:hypothetical protein
VPWKKLQIPKELLLNFYSASFKKYISQNDGILDYFVSQTNVLWDNIPNAQMNC